MEVVRQSLNITFLLIKLIYFILEAIVRIFIHSTPKDVSKEIVLITGGAQGIGREVAFGYGRLGATVVIVDVNSDTNQTTLSDLKKDGLKAFAYTCDITNREQVLHLARKIEEEVGPVSIVVNNAGFITSKPIEQQNERDVRQTFDVNIIAHFWVIQAFLPGMKQRDRGHIVAMSSCAGLTGVENATTYCATKWAVRGLMASLTRELEESKSNVKVTTVCPFFVKTGFCKNPKVGMLRLLSPRTVARELIKAQRTDVETVSIPRSLQHINNVANVLPLAAVKAGTKANFAVIREYVTVVLDVAVLIVQIIVSLAEATYRLFSPPEEKSVKSDIVLVTGSAQGIGKELVRQYGQLGAKVICVDYNQELNNETVKFLQSHGVQAYAYQCDVTNRQEVLDLAQKVRREVGDVTILVNNAGIMPCKPLLSHTESDIRRVFDVNIMAHFWMLEAFLPSMMEANYGHIVALSSIAGLEGYPNVVPYNSTKFAVRGLMEGMYEEFRAEGRSIKFTTICPFMVDTGLCKKPRIRFNYLLGMLRPEDVASIIIKAQRQGLREISIPRYIRPSLFLLRLLPESTSKAFHDFVNTGVEASDP